MPELYTVMELARVLKVSERTVWTWVAEGRWPEPDVKVSRKCSRWTRQSVEKFFKKNVQIGAD